MSRLLDEGPIGRAMDRSFECWVSIVAMVNVVSFFLRPDANPIHALVSPWDSIWAIDYGLAGLLMLIGLARKHGANIEVAGLMLLIGGLLVQILVFASLGVHTLNGTWGAIVSLVSLAVLAAYRVRALVKASNWLKGEDRR